MPDLFLIPRGSSDFIIPKTYADLGLSIEIVPIQAIGDWYKAGYLKILLPRGSDWIAIKSIPLTWQQIVEIPYRAYRLSFTPQAYLPDCNLIVDPYQLHYNPMSVYNPSLTPPAVGADTPTTVTASVTNVVALPANANRAPNGTIVNNANKVMWVSFTGAAATTATPSLSIPANGGERDIPGGYTGAINAIWQSGATGNAVFHEFSYQ
jgi:hypothetical protein